MNMEKADYSEVTKVIFCQMFRVLHCLYVCDSCSETRNRLFLTLKWIEQVKCAFFHAVLENISGDYAFVSCFWV